MILSGNLSSSHVGIYLHSLKERFRGEVVIDMLCCLRLHLELSLRAKGLLMMREAGFPVALDAADKAKLDELDFLERSIGATGKLAMAPFLRTSSRDLWQIYMMRDEAGATGNPVTPERRLKRMDMNKAPAGARASCRNPTGSATARVSSSGASTPGRPADSSPRTKPRDEGTRWRPGIEALADPARPALRAGPMVDAPDLPGDGRGGQGRRDQARDVGRQSSGLPGLSRSRQPSAEELDHDFLWRTTKCLPERGRIGVFNRSYYEEVLVVRVHPGDPREPEAPAQARDEEDLGASLREHPRLRAPPRRATASSSASSSSTSRRKSSSGGSWSGSKTRTRTGSSPRPTQQSASAGTIT